MDVANAAGTSVFHISAAGFVGISSTTPGQALDVNGNINVAPGKCFMVNDVCIGYVVKLVAIYSTSTPTGTSDDLIKLTGASGSAPSFSAGTLSLPSNTSYFVVDLWGGGGGGGESGTAAGTTAPAAGGSSTFGNATATSTSGGGGAGVYTAAAAKSGGAGGTATAISSPNTNISIAGQAGGNVSVGTSQFTSGAGGDAPRGGEGGQSLIDTTTTTGNAGTAPGGGGGGAAYTTAGDAGSGGGSGGFTETLFSNASGTYAATVGAGGAGGTAGTSGGAGGAGGSGAMIISVYATSSPNATGNDYAEMFPVSNPTIGAGDIVAVDSGIPVSMTLAQQGSPDPLAGVVSTAPGQVLGDQSDTSERPIALSGRVPVEVNLQNGPINIGDRIAVSSVPGVGMKAGPFDDSVGIALESYDGTTGTVQPNGSVEGTITVFIDLQQGIDINDIELGLLGQSAFNDISASASSSSSTSTPSLDFIGGIMDAITARITAAVVNGPTASSTETAAASSTSPIDEYANGFLQGIFGQITQWLANAQNGIGDLYANAIHAHTVSTDTICVNKSDGTPVCVTGDQLAAVLATIGQSGSGAATSSPGAASTSPSSANATDTPPVIQVNGDDPAEVSVGATYNDLGATITGPTGDLNLGIQVSVDGGATTTPDQIQIDTSQPGTHTIIYSATDQNGLIGYATRTVIVSTPIVSSGPDDPNATSSVQSDASDDSSSSPSNTSTIATGSSDSSDTTTDTDTTGASSTSLDTGDASSSSSGGP